MTASPEAYAPLPPAEPALPPEVAHIPDAEPVPYLPGKFFLPAEVSVSGGSPVVAPGELPPRVSEATLRRKQEEVSAEYLRHASGTISAASQVSEKGGPKQPTRPAFANGQRPGMPRRPTAYSPRHLKRVETSGPTARIRALVPTRRQRGRHLRRAA